MYAILKDKEVVEITDALEWARGFETTSRKVCHTVLNLRKNIFVSTVFLGLDHGVTERLWFESMVFGTSINERTFRYSTWAAAEKGHKVLVRQARQARQLRGTSRLDRKKVLKQMDKVLVRMRREYK